MRFDLTDLKLFVHIADSGSITAGAALMHLALPSASARVRGMEEALNVPLLQRGRRGAEPTEAGRTLLQHARIILRQVDDMQADLAQFATGLKGQVRLLCNTSAMTEFLPDALATFLAAHPQLSINLEERLSRDIVQAVADGAADIGIITDAVDRAALQTFPFRDDPLVLAMARSHPLAHALGHKRHVAFEAALDMTSSAWPATAPCSSTLRDRRNGWAAACTARSACAALKPSAAWLPAAPDWRCCPKRQRAAARTSAHREVER
jgi:DNA-binding transcriptional LysR family regulator